MKRSAKSLAWGRVVQTPQDVERVYSSTDDVAPMTQSAASVLPHGLGRSYGDSCLNTSGKIIDATSMDRLLLLDTNNGLLRAEAGVSLETCLQVAVPHGWFLPVVPGTKFVTLGGAVANDIHGKNHHGAGTFGCHVRRFELVRSDGRRLICSPLENRDLFDATIGGLGLTGLITWVEVILKKITSPTMLVSTKRSRSLDETLAQLAEADSKYEYTVFWMDLLASGTKLGRGVLLGGDHPREQVETVAPHGKAKLRMPLDAPVWTLNRFTVQAFNFLYYQTHRDADATPLHYDPYFFPLDSVLEWNRIYGRRGFFQYQFVVPKSETAALRKILEIVVRSGEGSFLSVLKQFGTKASPGMMSFPMPGYTLAVDFKNQGKKTLKVFERLDEIVIAAGGRVYPAKDARMPAGAFQKYFPKWSTFEQYIDPKFTSNFWKRVKGNESR
jgi:FAD/FMN-containing dehydrogenase